MNRQAKKGNSLNCTTLFVLAAGLAIWVAPAPGCGVKSPPARSDIQQKALPAMALADPWKSRSAVVGPIQDNWLATFEDPQLTALVNEAVAHNADLRISATRVEEAAAYVRLAKGKLRPAVTLFGRGSTKIGGDLSTGLSGGLLAASWEIDLWGRLRYGRNAAEENYASVLADDEYAKQSIAAATANAWFTATETLREQELGEEMVTFSTQLVSVAGTRLHVGAGREQDLVIARATMNGYQDSVARLKDAHEQSLRALELLLGRYPGAELQAKRELTKLPAPIPAGVPLQVLERRPDMLAAERRVAAAFNRVGEAKAAQLPQLSLNASFGAVTSSVLALKEGFSNPVGGVAASLLAPLYMGGQLKATVVIRTVEEQRAIAEYAKTALIAINDVEKALSTGESLREREAIWREAIAQNERAVELNQVAYRVGSTDLRDVLEQQIILQGTKISLLQIQSEELSQRVNLNLALGIRYAP